VMHPLHHAPREPSPRALFVHLCSRAREAALRLGGRADLVGPELAVGVEPRLVGAVDALRVCQHANTPTRQHSIEHAVARRPTPRHAVPPQTRTHTPVRGAFESWPAARTVCVGLRHTRLWGGAQQVVGVALAARRRHARHAARGRGGDAHVRRPELARRVVVRRVRAVDALPRAGMPSARSCRAHYPTNISHVEVRAVSRSVAHGGVRRANASFTRGHATKAGVHAGAPAPSCGPPARHTARAPCTRCCCGSGPPAGRAWARARAARWCS
jgi:hypothetical protein